MKNSSELLSFFVCQDDFNRVNNFLYKAKTRFETLKGVLETAPKFIKDDMANALILSFKDYYSAIREVVDRQNWCFQEFEDTNSEFIKFYFGNLDFDDSESYALDSKNSSKFYSKLAAETNGANAYLQSLLVAQKVLENISFANSRQAKIVREITFPPELTQAGIGLLSYFSTIIEKKYPDMEITVSIQQSGNTVTMTITHPDGRQDEIVHTLNSYGLVLIGKKSAEEILEDKIQVLALKHKLEIAKMEVSQVKEILELERQGSNTRISSLESEVKNLRDLVGTEMQFSKSVQNKFIDLISSYIDMSNQNVPIRAIQELGSAISERNASKAELILDDMSEKEPALFEKINKLIAEGAVAGVIGNSAYSWLVTVIAGLPK